ncbi:MAG: family 10 glycosylhydrolase, partial [Blastocatellia bacterium]|nr:family 10 glycosylhydrolase [Blastocatellia bacterium]
MKRALIIICCYVLLLLSALLPTQQTAAPSKTLLLPLANSLINPIPGRAAQQEARALWVKRESLSKPGDVKDAVRRASANGFTDLVIQVRSRGDAYYQSSIEPRGEGLDGQPPDFDPLALAIEEAHRVGIRVHAWINIFLVSSMDKLPKSENHVIYKHPEWLTVPRALAVELYHTDPTSPDYLRKLAEYSRANRTDLEGLFLSPANPGVRENIYDIWMDVARKYDVDGMHFDYVRYPNPRYDYSRTSLERFRSEVEKSLNQKARDALRAQAASDPLAYVTAFPDRYAQFQCNQVSELVGQVYKGIKKFKPGLIISAAVFANDDAAIKWRFQDWKSWVKRGWLDVLCPMAYTTNPDIYRKQIQTVVKNSNGKPVWGGIGSFHLTAEGSLERIRMGRELGAQGFILFSYDSSVAISSLN